MLLKQKENKNKIIKIGLMGVCSNYHEHENNQISNIFKTKMRIRVGLFSNSNCEVA
jgi:hypothetical protein